MNVGIYGLGVVGGALAKFLESTGHHVLRKDPGLGFDDDFGPDPKRRPDALFICVPVPTKAWKQDLAIIREILETWKPAGPSFPIFLRSTVLPGTCNALAEEFGLNVIAFPEFLTERKAQEDTERLPIIYGAAGFRVIPRLFPDHHRVAMSNAEAEMAKYAHNCFGALKVTYFNAIENQCRKMGLIYSLVLEGVLASGHINRQHTMVPGPDGKRGYGGKCFPKDMEAFVGFLKGDIFGRLLVDAHCMNRFYRGLKDADQMPKGELDL